MKYTYYRQNDCLVIRMKYDASFKQSFLFTSDEHFDNKKCDRKSLKNHLNEAKQKGWG